MIVLDLLSIIAAVILLLYAAYVDFTRWKIPNNLVLALIAVYAILVLSRYLSDGSEGLLAGVYGDLGAGALLFLLGFAFWLFKLMGAGDAKLFFPIGLFVGWGHLLPFGLALAVLGVLSAIILKFPVPLHYQVFGPMARIEEIRKSGKVPYGVIMVAAALFAMWMRYLPG